MPEENIGPMPRRTTQCTDVVGGGGAQRLADGGDQLAVEGVALVGAVEHDVADRAVRLGDHEGHWRERSLGRASGMSPRTPIGHDLLERLASLEAVDGPAKQLAKAVRSLKAPTKVDEALAGTWLGHPVHPLLIVVPMGSWISAVLVDWLGGEDAETAADLLVGAGLAGAVPTVATGYADWADTELASDTVRRIGIVHAAFNATATALFAASLAARAAGARGRGKLLALAGLGAVGVGGYLGGHLTYAEGVGVNVATFEEYPQDWTQALADAALGEGEMRAVDVDGVAIVIARSGGEVYALSDTCVHRGGSLADGELVGELRAVPAPRLRVPARGRLGRAGPGRLPAAGARGARARRLDRGPGAAAPVAGYAPARFT